jgi:hypothetical protein
MISDSSHDALTGLPVSAACVLPLPSWELNTLPTQIASQDQSEASSVITSSPENHVSNTHSNGLPGMFSTQNVRPPTHVSAVSVNQVQEPIPTTEPHGLKTIKSSRQTPNSESSPPGTTNPTTSTSRIQKRTLNTLAARRYRQKRVDQMADLEAALKETEKERDALKNRVARLEGEVEVLMGLVGTRS